MRLKLKVKRKKKFYSLRLVCLPVDLDKYDVYYFGSYVGHIYSPGVGYFAFLDRSNFVDKTCNDLDTLKGMIRKSLDRDIQS